jgi:hypothetical protein
MRLMKWKFVASLVGAIVMTGSLAKADTITGTLDTVNPGETITVSGNGEWAGQIVWDEQGGGTFSTYCTQLHTLVYQGSTISYDIVPLATVPDLSTTGSATSASLTEAAMIENVVGSAPAATNDQAAAVQLSIWKIIYDYSSSNATWASSSQGNITWDATSSWGSDAVTDLGYATAPINPVTMVGLEASVQDQTWVQPLIGGGPLGGSSAVPEPSVVLSVLSLAGLVGFGKARKLLNR